MKSSPSIITLRSPPVFVIRMFSMSRLSLSALHWAIFPNLSDNVNLVVATIGDVEEVSLSSDPEDSPGDPVLFLVLSFLILVNNTGSDPFSFIFLTGFSGGFTPVTSITSPVRPLGLGGGGCLLGSVGLSDELGFWSLRAGGGVIGLGILLGGDGDGDGGLGRTLDFNVGDVVFVWVLTRERGTENERDLDRGCLWFVGEHTEQESSEQLRIELADADRRPEAEAWCGGGERGLAGRERAAGGGDRRPTGDRL
jgi:hypothetical protein